MPKFRAESGSTLAFDFGLARTGVAQGDAVLRIAHPLINLEASTHERRLQCIAPLIEEWLPAQLVVGLPFHLDGIMHEMSAMAINFGKKCSRRFGLPVYLVDERLSSALATSMLQDINVFGRRHKKANDAVAAQIILNTFFDHGACQFLAPHPPVSSS